MGSLFDLPKSRTTKKADKTTVNKSSSKKSASSISMRGNGIIDQIALIKKMVNDKLSDYKDDCILGMSDNNVYNEYIEDCIKNGIVAIDTETTGLDPILDEIVGISFYTPNNKALYVPINHMSYITNMPIPNQLSINDILNGLIKLVENKVKIVMFNAKFDIKVILNKIGIRLPIYFDGYLAGKVLNENESSAGLKSLYNKYVLGDTTSDKWNFDTLFKGIDFRKVPIEYAGLYASHDSKMTYDLYQFQLPYLTPGTEECLMSDLSGCCSVFWDIEMRCIDTLVDMEQTGINFDVDYAEELSVKYHKILDENLATFYSELEVYKDEIENYKSANINHKLSNPLNVSSPTQLAILFYDILKLPVVDEKTPRGTGVDILAKIDNNLSKSILKYRETDKLLSTYIDKLPNCINSKTKRIHCGINQYGAKTGRMSSDNPNLQNIPSHNKDIRKMFVPTEGYVLMSADFSQQEPRAMCAMCGDPTMINAYKQGKDLYASIASLAFNKPYEDCLEFNADGSKNPEGKERRSQSKSILLGILYGRGINSVAEQLHTTKEKAQQIQDKVFKGFPAIKKFEEDSLRMAKENGYVTTFWGRKRRLPEMQLPEFEFSYMEGYGDVDPLSFDDDFTTDIAVPQDIIRKYTVKLRQNPYKKRKVYEEAKNNGIIIVDNGGKIADATRQTVNARIQGSASDLTKLAGIEISKNEELKSLGFRLLVPIHDEYLAECPIENAKRCAELFSYCMNNSARDLGIPMNCDVEITSRWYGEEIKL